MDTNPIQDDIEKGGFQTVDLSAAKEAGRMVGAKVVEEKARRGRPPGSKTKSDSGNGVKADNKGAVGKDVKRVEADPVVKDLCLFGINEYRNLITGSFYNDALIITGQKDFAEKIKADVDIAESTRNKVADSLSRIAARWEILSKYADEIFVGGVILMHGLAVMQTKKVLLQAKNEIELMKKQGVKDGLKPQEPKNPDIG